MANKRRLYLEERLAKSGAIVSSAGVAMLVAFVAVLLAFPVNKECEKEGTGCTYSSTAPDSLSAIVQPGYLASSLSVIAAGVFMVRFGRWQASRKSASRV
ncbi:MAG: hypothetical protein ACREAZ_07655 [Nitrososphaera sp.]